MKITTALSDCTWSFLVIT